MTCNEAAEWVRGRCADQGNDFTVNPRADGWAEVLVNNSFVFGYNSPDQEIAREDVERAYEAAAQRPLVAPLDASEREYAQADLELRHPAVLRIARQMEWLDEHNVVYHRALPDEDDGTFAMASVFERDSEDIPEIKFMKDREAKMANGWTNSWTNSFGTAVTSMGNVVPMMNATYDHVAYFPVMCKANIHYLGEGVEFCERCCWNCQTGEGPFCASCRKIMRAEQKEDECIRSFASEHFPSLVPFLD